jgi:Bacterial Ig domain
MRALRTRSILGVALTVGAILLVGQPSVAAPPAPIPMPITVADPTPASGVSGGLPFTKAAAWSFDVDDNDYEATLLANGYAQDAAGNAAWSSLFIQCAVVTSPTRGTLAPVPNKPSLCDWTYTPNGSWNGTDTMTYRVEYLPPGSATRISTAVETVNISGPTLTTPTLVADSVVFTTPAGGDFDVDDNDFNTTLSSNSWTSGTWATAMWNRMNVTCSAVTNPTKGTIVPVAAKPAGCDWTYTPGPAWNGTDTMTYRLTYIPAGGGTPVTTAPQTVNFSGPVASPVTMPTLVNDTVNFTNVPTTRNFGVKSNDYETTLTAAGLTPYTKPGNDAWDPLLVLCKVATPPAHGSLTLIEGAGYGSECDWTYTPNSTFTGNDSMTYKMEYRNATGTRVLTAATATVTFAGPASTPTPPSAASPLVPLVAPARSLDTRPGNASVDGLIIGDGPSPAGSITSLLIAGRSDVPSDATAVVLNVTTTGTKAPGFLTVYPCEQDTPTASNLNYGTNATIANAVTTEIDADGLICIYTSAETNLIIDVNGFYPAGSTFTPLAPARLLETRPGSVSVDGQQQGAGPSAGGSVTEVKVTGRAGVPNDPTAVVLNVTATGTKAPGFLTVYPCGQATPTASNLNYGTNDTIANAVTTKIGTDGKVCIYTSSQTNLITDLNGFYSTGSSFTSLAPARLLETRPGNITVDGLFQGQGPSAAGSVTEVQITGRATVPNNASAVVVNVTATGTKAPGFLTVFPCGQAVPTASNLNYGNDTTIANAVTTKIGTAGKICIYTSAETNLITDINGYFPA